MDAQTRETLAIISHDVFNWALSLALILTALDWIYPYTVAPFFNVAWLIAVAMTALVVTVFFSPHERLNRRPPPLFFVVVLFVSFVAARPMGGLAALFVAVFITAVVWATHCEKKPVVTP